MYVPTHSFNVIHLALTLMTIDDGATGMFYLNPLRGFVVKELNIVYKCSKHWNTAPAGLRKYNHHSLLEFLNGINWVPRVDQNSLLRRATCHEHDKNTIKCFTYFMDLLVVIQRSSRWQIIRMGNDFFQKRRHRNAHATVLLRQRIGEIWYPITWKINANDKHTIWVACMVTIKYLFLAYILKWMGDL